MLVVKLVFRISKNIILNVGRFVDGKNQHLLVKYFKKAAVKNWKVIFVGDGPNLQEVKDYVENERMDDVVEFHGSIKDIEEYYKMSKVFAFTSSTEGFPNVLGEAMSPISLY